MNISIIGVGLIGGSLALGLKENGFATKILGIDSNDKNLKDALDLGIIDEISDLKNINKSDLIIVSIPVNPSLEVIKEVLELVDNKIVTDMGSTKKNICEIINNHHNRSCFVPSHPIAGTENSGPKAAIKNLFDKKLAIICDDDINDTSKSKTIEEMYKSLNMRVIYMNSEDHDLHMAYVSHLSHISSFALGLTVLDKEKDESTIFNLAGSGFESTVRLAKSSPDMWNPIFEQNSKNISEALGEYIKQLEKFKNSIDNREYYQSYEMMQNANDIRRILDGMIKK
ncbi:MAG: prephenate dehydrogenase [Candidatus Sericytochromatia bacterium]